MSPSRYLKMASVRPSRYVDFGATGQERHDMSGAPADYFSVLGDFLISAWLQLGSVGAAATMHQNHRRGDLLSSSQPVSVSHLCERGLVTMLLLPTPP